MVAIHENDMPSLLNSFHEGICCLNAQGEVQCHNETATVHWDGEQFLSKTMPSLPAVTRGLAGEEVAHELIDVNGRRTLLVNIMPLYAGTNAVTRVVIISHDVSEPVQLERQAEVALRVLTEATIDTTNIEQIEEAIRRVAALLPQLEAVDHSIAFRLEGATLIPLAIFGHNDETYEQWHSDLIAAKLSIEDALKYPGSAYLHTLQLARSVMIDFAENTSMYTNPHNLQAAIYAPVLVDSKIVGLLGVERERPRDELGTFFPQWSIDLLTALARLTSMALEKSALLGTVAHLQDETEEARKLLNQKEEFLSLAAHELKNPLTAIRGQAQVMRRRINRAIHATEAPDEQTHDLIKSFESVERQTYRIEQIINTLLTTNRVDLDRLELKFQPVDLVQLAKHTLEGQLPSARNHELRLVVAGQVIQLDTNKQAGVPSVMVQGDESRLEEMLANLLSNAIRYSPHGGPIIVSLRELAGDFVEIAVQDQGIGIPQAAQAHLAERFYRAENARRVSGQGLGLGLYLVNALAIRHGGHLSVESEGIPGKGSTIRITLPAQQ